MIDVFKVGVHVAMTSNAGQVLGLLLREMTGLHVEVDKLERGLGRVQKAAIGAAAVFAGGMMIKGLLDATKHAEKLNHELVKLQSGARLTDAQTEQERVSAFAISRQVRGSNAAENVKVKRELFGVLGDMGEAGEIAPQVVQGSRAVSNYVDKETDLATIAVRALENRGHITKDGKVDPKEFTQEFNAMVRSIYASEGLIDPQKLFMFIRQAGPAARNMNSNEMWGMAPGIMNALGSGPAGTAMMSLFSQMVGHVVAGKRVAVAMEHAGMLTPGKWSVGKGGKVIMAQDAVPDQKGFADHPLTWLHEHLEAMRAQKDSHGKPIDAVGIVQEIFQLASRATSARLINDVDTNWPIIKNEEKRWERMPNPDVLNKEQNDKDLSVNIHNLSAAWDNFMAALGGPGIPIAIGVLSTLTDALNFLQAAIIKHPTIAADLFYLAGGIGALTALGGGLMILNATWAPFVGGIKLLISALSAAEATTAVASAGSLSLGIRGIVGAIAAAAGLTAAAAGIVAVIAAIAKLGSDNESSENREKLNQLRRDRGTGLGPSTLTPQDGFGVDGLPVKKSAYIMPANDAAPHAQKIAYVHVVNGRDIADGAVRHMARQASRPNMGSGGFDGRMTPSFPNNAVAI